MHCITRIVEKSIDSAEDDPFVSDDEVEVEPSSTVPPAHHSELHPDDDDREKATRSLMPSPLRVRKSSGDLASASCRLPLAIVPVAPHGQKRGADGPCVSSSGSVRYSKNVHSLLSQVESSVSAVHSLIDEVTELQRLCRAGRIHGTASFGSVSPLKADSETDSGHATHWNSVFSSRRRGLGSPRVKETKEQRIARLRAAGWATVGLKSGRRGWKGVQYYRAYCDAVLDELYLDV